MASSDAGQEEREKDLDSFCAQYDLKLNRKKRRQLLQESTFEQYEAYKVGLEVSFCCKNTDLDKARLVYHRAAHLSLRLAAHSYHNLLCLAAGLGEPGNGSQSQRLAEPPHDLGLASRIYDEMRSLGIAPSEASCSALIRCHCQCEGEGEDDHGRRALEIYEEMKRQNVAPKGRTFSALLQHFARRGDASQCFALRDEMRRFAVPAAERDYASLLRVCLSTRDAARFHVVLDEMMDELLLLYSRETLDVVSQWFTQVEPRFARGESVVDEKGAVGLTAQRLRSIDLDDGTRDALLDALRAMAVQRDPAHRYKPNNKIAQLQAAKTEREIKRDRETKSEIVAQTETETVTVRDATGETMRETKTHRESEIVAETEIERDTQSPVVASTETEIVIETETKTEKETERDAEQHAARLSQWLHFTQFVDAAQIDVVVDGANVGYFAQNFAAAPPHVDYLQIHQLLLHVMDHCGKRPLLVLHSRHVAEKVLNGVAPYEFESLVNDDDDFSLSLSASLATRRVRLTAREMVEEWRRRGVLYATPKGFNDDWFWMHAALRRDVAVVTNDEMRDHHFALLSQRCFTRWRERHRVRYSLFYRYPAVLRRLLPRSESEKESERELERERHAARDADEAELDALESDRSEEEQSVKVRVSTSLSASPSLASLRRLVRFNPAYRRVALHWPLPYSFRMQRVQCALGTGFYFPAVVDRLPSHAPPRRSEDHDNNDEQPPLPPQQQEPAAPQGKAVDAHTSTAELIENLPLMVDKERLALPWTAFFAPSLSLAVAESSVGVSVSLLPEMLGSALGKRAREEELDPVQLARQITKDF